MININCAPLGCNVAIGAGRTGLGMISGLAARHGTVVALHTSRWYALENCSGMTSFTGDIGVSAFKREVSCVMIEITVNLDPPIDFLGKRHGTDTENHSEPNREVSHHVEQQDSIQFSHSSKASLCRFP